jgi:hypothetical protein
VPKYKSGVNFVKGIGLSSLVTRPSMGRRSASQRGRPIDGLVTRLRIEAGA